MINGNGQVRTSWFKENSTLIYFLIAQMIAMAAGSASIIAYSVRLETRVHILETRGAAYSVARMDAMTQKITVLEQKIENNEDSIKRIVDVMIRELKVGSPPLPPPNR
jgi:hypothetical protein